MPCRVFKRGRGQFEKSRMVERGERSTRVLGPGWMDVASSPLLCISTRERMRATKTSTGTWGGVPTFSFPKVASHKLESRHTGFTCLGGPYSCKWRKTKRSKVVLAIEIPFAYKL